MSVHILSRDEVSPLRAHEVHKRRDYSYRFAVEPVGGGLKRIFDAIAASSALLILAPLLMIVALIIRLESPGPALFRQRRSGYRGKAFSIYKFRTMRADACKGPVHQAQRQDARVTRVGAFLRKTSIDELPQLLNVLRGEMSIVGPRPHAVTHDYDFCSVDARYPSRFFARPGLTGLAQVSGCRGLSDTPDKVRDRTRCDLAYLTQWSIAMDAWIIWKTACVLFRDRNAF